jgi:hypothetical protein
MALSEQEVRDIWERQWEAAKPFVDVQSDRYNGQIQPNGKDQLPELWPGYNAAYWQREDLLPHIEHGVYPYRLFRERAPNQSPEEFAYIHANYQQTTLDVYLDAENTIGRAIGHGNYSVQWEEGNAITDIIREYLEGGIKEWGSLSTFVQRILVRLKMEDAMGVLAFVPESIPTIELERDGELVMVIDPQGSIRPDIHYIKCSQVWGFEYDRYYLLRMNDDAEVKHGNKSAPGVLCLLVDDTYVWKITQTGRKSDWTFEIEQWYEHGAGEPPCIHLGGVPVVRGGSLAFESPFLAAVGPLNTALADAQYLQASKVKCVYPQVVMVGDTCDFFDETAGKSCFDGKIDTVDSNGMRVLKTCPGCKGTGKMRRLGPLNELIINPSTRADGVTQTSDGVNASNALSYVSPPTDGLRFNREDIERNEKKARAILHLNAETPMAGGDAKTATEAGLNNRAKDAFVKPIADQIIGIEEFATRVIGRQIAGSEWDGFKVRKPTQYDLRTEADRIAEITTARDAGIPPAIIDEMEGDLIAARYSNNPFMTEAMEVIQRADRLARMSSEVITAEAAAGRVQAWEIALHYAALDLYRMLYDTDAAFARADLWGKLAGLHAKAKELYSTAPARTATSPMQNLLAVVNA